MWEPGHTPGDKSPNIVGHPLCLSLLGVFTSQVLLDYIWFSCPGPGPGPFWISVPGSLDSLRLLVCVSSLGAALCLLSPLPPRPTRSALHLLGRSREFRAPCLQNGKPRCHYWNIFFFPNICTFYHNHLVCMKWFLIMVLICCLPRASFCVHIGHLYTSSKKCPLNFSSHYLSYLAFYYWVVSVIYEYWIEVPF